MAKYFLRPRYPRCNR